MSRAGDPSEAPLHEEIMKLLDDPMLESGMIPGIDMEEGSSSRPLGVVCSPSSMVTTGSSPSERSPLKSGEMDEGTCSP